MQTLLNLLAGVSLLVWGTHIVRTGILRLYGGDLRRAAAPQRRATALTAFFAGLGVTGLIQSSTATALIVAAFAGQGLIAHRAGAGGDARRRRRHVARDARAVVRPVVARAAPDLRRASCCSSRGRTTNVGRFGRILIGLGLIIFALQWIRVAAQAGRRRRPASR